MSKRKTVPASVAPVIAPAQEKTEIPLGKLIAAVEAINTILFETEAGQVSVRSNGRPVERALNLSVAYRLIAAGKAINPHATAFDEARNRAISKATERLTEKRAEMGLVEGVDPLPEQGQAYAAFMDLVNAELNAEVRELESQAVLISDVKTIRLSLLEADGVRLGGLQLDSLMGWLVVDDE